MTTLKFRVLGAHANRNFFDIEVEATDGMSAFGAAALVLREADEDGAAEFFAAIPAGTQYTLPGDCVVTLESLTAPALAQSCEAPAAPTLDQGALADQAFAEYNFGEGVYVTDSSGWEYSTPGHERTRKVYVETDPEDDGPAPRWSLNFTVRFDPETCALSEVYAMDDKGQVWGHSAADLSACCACGDKVLSLIGCPDGSEICNACFNAGGH